MDNSGNRPDSGSEQEGEALLETLVAASGLPKDAVVGELDKILHEVGYKPDRELTLDELRQAMLVYLESLNETLSQEMGESEQAQGMPDVSPIFLSSVSNERKTSTRH